jgi:hypothetical protein
MTRTVRMILASLLTLTCASASAGPDANDWSGIAKLPDWSGTWIPDIRDQNAQVDSNPTPWTPEVQKQVDRMNANEAAGNPKGLFINCLPEGMPSWMLISHNAMEVLFSPGRVTLLGESDGNRLRRIYTDGRPPPADPDPSFHGYSVGHWEGDTLVAETTGVYPEAYIAVSESVGVPNDGDMRVAERIRLTSPDTLADDMVITAPHVLSHPWKTTRLFHRAKGPHQDILEGVCLEGAYSEGKDKDGNAAFLPLAHDQGIPVPPGEGEAAPPR